MKIALSPAQRQIVEAPDGPCLVVAAAGSGKTRILTERIRFLLEVRKIRSRVMALTFTNKAAHEMRERLADIDDLSERTYIGTIHGFCQSVIESYGHVLGYERTPTILERESDRMALLEEVFEENAELTQLLRQKESAKERRSYLYGILGQFSGWKRNWDDYERVTSGDWPNETEAMVFRQYNDRLAGQGAIDFDDILLIAYRILLERPKVAEIYQRTYRHVCVDEAQDLNAVQYSLIRTLAENERNLLMVGDPNQAIYGFNGSSKDFMLRSFTADFSPAQTELKENFRSSRSVIRAANALYPDSIDLSNVAFEGILEIKPFPNESEEAGWIVEKIRELLDLRTHPELDGVIAPNRIAVLARNRYVFGPLETLLDETGMPFHLRQPAGGAALESRFGQILDHGLRMLVNPKDRLHYRELGRLLQLDRLPEFNKSDPLNGLKSLLNQAGAAWEDQAQALFQAWTTLFSDVSRFNPVLERLSKFLRDEGARTADPSEQEELLRAIADVDFLRQVWDNYARQVAQGSRSLGHFRNQMAMGATTPHAEAKGLTLATVHAVKGLEFDIVFLVGLADGCFPDYRAIRKGGAALAEERNDAFVAITRSKRFLYMTWPQARFMPWDKDNRVAQKGSRFLSEILQQISSKDAQDFRVAEDPPNPYRPS